VLLFPHILTPSPPRPVPTQVQNIHGLNIGVIYCQNCAPGGRGAWVLHETVRPGRAAVWFQAVVQKELKAYTKRLKHLLNNIYQGHLYLRLKLSFK
jgi:hypothetical protein